MSSRERFVRCLHCGMPHEENEKICPITGKDVVVKPRRAPGVSAQEPSSPRITPPRSAPSPIASPMVFDAAPGMEPEPSFVGRLLEDKYLVKEVIGRGGMGAVYRAENVRIGKQVAIKILHRGHDPGSSSSKRLYREARLMGSLGHPNIVEIYDLGALDDGAPFQVMELLEGESLAARIRLDGGMPIEESLAIADDVLSALDAAHARGIVHRDLKPDNVFLARKEGRVVTKLLDFGISKTIGDETLSLTKTGMVVGTPFYLAPEQARGEDVDQRIDVWAMGVLLYEMLTGVTPFHAENYNKLIVRILTTRPEPPTRRRPALAPIVEEVILTALAHDRAQRYRDASAMREALRAARAGARVPVTYTAPVEPLDELDVDLDPTEVSDTFRR
jgi:serine/threonine-protein kinase